MATAKARAALADTNGVILHCRILDGRTGETLWNEMQTKNLAAVALGRLGGKKGGAVRAKKLSARSRSSQARKAATARWSKRGSR